MAPLGAMRTLQVHHSTRSLFKEVNVPLVPPPAYLRDPQTRGTHGCPLLPSSSSCTGHSEQRDLLKAGRWRGQKCTQSHAFQLSSCPRSLPAPGLLRRVAGEQGLWTLVWSPQMSSHSSRGCASPLRYRLGDRKEVPHFLGLVLCASSCPTWVQPCPHHLGIPGLCPFWPWGWSSGVIVLDQKLACQFPVSSSDLDSHEGGQGATQ